MPVVGRGNDPDSAPPAALARGNGNTCLNLRGQYVMLRCLKSDMGQQLPMASGIVAYTDYDEKVVAAGGASVLASPTTLGMLARKVRMVFDAIG
jgi:hypothetical protein